MARLTKIIYCLLILFLGFQAQAKNPPPGIGTNIPANVLIMLDISGSMNIALYSTQKTYYPIDTATDSSGNIYILGNYDRITVLDSSGNHLRTFGGRGTSCNRWYDARQFAIYNDRIYVADYYGHKIKVVDLYGNCIRSISTLDGNMWRSNSNPYPSGIAVGNSYIYVSYWNNKGRITIHNTSNLSKVKTFTDTSRLYYNLNVNLNASGNALLVASTNRWGGIPVAKYTVSGSTLTYSTGIGTHGYNYGNGYIYFPFGVDFDSNDNIYVDDHYLHRIQKFNSSGTYQAKTGSYSNNPFKYPRGIYIDSSDNIYVSDTHNHATRKFDTSLTLQETIGAGGGTRLEVAKKVIKKIVSDSSLTAGTNFGFMTWANWPLMRVKVSDKGAKEIYSDIGRVRVGQGGGTILLNAMNKARNEFTSGEVPNWNLKCSNNYLIVITDGYWWGGNPIPVAENLYKQYGIKTFVVGFKSGSNSNFATLATKGGTGSPLYADDEKALFKKLTEALKQVAGDVSYNTLNTPVVIEEITKSNYIYQSTFEYKENAQWPGHLKKYELNSNGTFGNIKWDAAVELNKKKASARNIWTAGLSTKSTNNFTTSYRDELEHLLFPNSPTDPTDAEIDDLINFIRGVDTYDEDADSNTTEERHKLNDIYNSEIMVVGGVSGTTTNDGSTNFEKKDAYYRSVNKYDEFKNGTSCGGKCSERKEVVFAGSNGGMLHAFNASDGEELWAFIPPNLLGKLGDMISSVANETNSIYGVDGSMVVKDIYYDDTPTNNKDDPVWKTILLGGLGAGGHGYFALDITDINSPKLLFAISNNTLDTMITYWDSDEYSQQFNYGGGSIASKYDYRKLGEAWSTPRIIRIKVEGKDKWVAVFGGGFNGAVNPNYGSAVFVMDLENEGKLLKEIAIEDKFNVMHDYVWGTIKAQYGTNTKKEWNLSSMGLHSLDTNCCALRLKGTTIPYNITGDFNKNTKKYTNLKIKFDIAPPSSSIFILSVVNKSDIVNSIPSDLTVITANGTDKANYSGAMVYAADLEGKINKINLTENFILDSDSNSKTFEMIKKNIQTTTLFNSQSSSTSNNRYIYHQAEVTINDDNNLWLYFGTGDMQKLETKANTSNRIYGIKDKDFPNFKTINTAGTVSQCKTAPNCPNSTDLGWYINLKKSQKLTASVTIDNDLIHYPVYQPTTSSNSCDKGDAIYCKADAKCGYKSTLGKECITLGKGVLSKIVVHKGKLYMGISGEAKTSGTGYTSKDSLITGASTSTAKKSGGKVQLEGWREIYEQFD